MFWGHSFLKGVPPESHSFTGVLAWDGRKTPASGGSPGTKSFASKEPIKIRLVSCRTLKGYCHLITIAVGWTQISDLEKEHKIPSDSLTLSEWWSDVMHCKCPVCKSPSQMTSLKFWGTEHFKWFAVLALLCSIKHYTPQPEGASMSIMHQYPLVTSHQHSSKKTNFCLSVVSIYLLPVLTLQEKKPKPLKPTTKLTQLTPFPNQNSSKTSKKLSQFFTPLLPNWKQNLEAISSGLHLFGSRCTDNSYLQNNVKSPALWLEMALNNTSALQKHRGYLTDIWFTP